MNWSRVGNTTASFVIFLSLILLAPAAIAAIYGEWRDFACFLQSAGGAFVLGMGVRFLTRRADRTVYRREGLLIVVGCWLAAALIGAVPFVLTEVAPSFEDAFFESMSGFTTTGSTVLTKLHTHAETTYGHGIMFWRSLTHWLGGMGIVVLFVAVLPALGASGRLLYEFEVPGIETDDLKPRIRETASLLWRIYLTLSLAEFVALLFCGMPPYDAAVHTFGTVASGGFSPHAASIRHYDSQVIEIVVTLFMFLSGVNFTLYYRARSRGLKVIWRDVEFRCYLFTTLAIALTCFLVLLGTGHEPAPDAGAIGPTQAAVDAAFVTVAIGTTTGFGTADYDRWPEILRFMLVVLMFMGGCSGSTAGGFKVFRVLVLFRVIQHELRRFVRPKRVRTLMIGGTKVQDELIRSILVFFVIAMITLFGTALIICALGHDMETSITATMATLFNIGPGLGMVGPTGDFADMHPIAKVLLALAMLIGRLEVFTAIAILQPSFYKD